MQSVLFCSPQVEASTHEVGICFQAGVHEQNVKSRSDDGCKADGFASEAKPPQVEASTHGVGICFQAGVHEQNEKSRSDDGCGAGGFVSEAIGVCRTVPDSEAYFHVQVGIS